MSTLWDDIYNNASNAVDSAKNYSHDFFNTARIMTNNVKYGALAFAASTMNGTGELLKKTEDGIANLKNVCVDKVASWAKPAAACGKILTKCSLPLKLLSAGDAAIDLSEGKSQKTCEFIGSWGLGAAAGTAAGILLVATPVGWTAAGIFVAGTAGAYAGDWLGSQIGTWIDGDSATSLEIKAPTAQPQAPSQEQIRNALIRIPEEAKPLTPTQH